MNDKLNLYLISGLDFLFLFQDKHQSIVKEKEIRFIYLEQWEMDALLWMVMDMDIGYGLWCLWISVNVLCNLNLGQGIRGA